MNFTLLFLVMSLRAFGLMMGYDWFVQGLIPGAGKLTYIDSLGVFLLANILGPYSKPKGDIPNEDVLEALLIFGVLVITMFVMHLISTVNISFQ